MKCTNNTKLAGRITIRFATNRNIGNGFNMVRFGKTEDFDTDEDVIVIHVGHLTDEQYNRVVDSLVAFMNARWPNLSKIGIDN